MPTRQSDGCETLRKKDYATKAEEENLAELLLLDNCIVIDDFEALVAPPACGVGGKIYRWDVSPPDFVYNDPEVNPLPPRMPSFAPSSSPSSAPPERRNVAFLKSFFSRNANLAPSTHCDSATLDCGSALRTTRRSPSEFKRGITRLPDVSNSMVLLTITMSPRCLYYGIKFLKSQLSAIKSGKSIEIDDSREIENWENEGVSLTDLSAALGEMAMNKSAEVGKFVSSLGYGACAKDGMDSDSPPVNSSESAVIEEDRSVIHKPPPLTLPSARFDSFGTNPCGSVDHSTASTLGATDGDSLAETRRGYHLTSLRSATSRRESRNTSVKPFASPRLIASVSGASIYNSPEQPCVEFAAGGKVGALTSRGYSPSPAPLPPRDPKRSTVQESREFVTRPTLRSPEEKRNSRYMHTARGLNAREPRSSSCSQPPRDHGNASTIVREGTMDGSTGRSRHRYIVPDAPGMSMRRGQTFQAERQFNATPPPRRGGGRTNSKNPPVGDISGAQYAEYAEAVLTEIVSAFSYSHKKDALGVIIEIWEISKCQHKLLKVNSSNDEKLAASHAPISVYSQIHNDSKYYREYCELLTQVLKLTVESNARSESSRLPLVLSLSRCVEALDLRTKLRRGLNHYSGSPVFETYVCPVRLTPGDHIYRLIREKGHLSVLTHHGLYVGLGWVIHFSGNEMALKSLLFPQQENTRLKRTSVLSFMKFGGSLKIEKYTPKDDLPHEHRPLKFYSMQYPKQVSLRECLKYMESYKLSSINSYSSSGSSGSSSNNNMSTSMDDTATTATPSTNACSSNETPWYELADNPELTVTRAECAYLWFCRCRGIQTFDLILVDDLTEAERQGMENNKSLPGYSIFSHNCEHFVRWCKTGVGVSKQSDMVGYIVDSVFRGFKKGQINNILNKTTQ